MRETFGQRLQAARKAAGYRTQDSLGDAIGTSGKTIRNYEGDKYRPPADALAKLRRLLGEFDVEGDPVEVAVRQSELIEWRQDAVLSTYKRNLHEQREERAG